MASRKRRSREPPAPHGQALPVADPAAELSPTAKRILTAARRVLSRDGFTGLTFEAISAEAGENKALIRYYFGNKNGLITALVDWIDHDDSVKLIRELSADESERDRIGVLLRMQRDGCKCVKDSQLFYDLLPHVLRDRTLRVRLGELYQWYRDLDGWVLAPDVSGETKVEVERLAVLTIAVCDGITLQCASDAGFDVDAVYLVWERLLKSALRELGIDVDTRHEREG